MADKSFADALNEQIANEFAASQQYVGAAVYYDAETLPRLATFFYRQALEEREHAMIMVRYLLDTDEKVHIPDIKAVETSYANGSEPVKMALEQEKRVSDEIFALFELARDLKDYRAEQFLQWFVKEQVEEVATKTFQLTLQNGTYSFVCDRHRNQMRGALTVGTPPPTPAPTPTPTPKPKASAPIGARILLTSGPGQTITMKTVAAKKVTNLRPGRYTIVARDRSTFHNEHILGAGVNRKTAVGTTSTQTWKVVLKKGTLTFICDPHKNFMRGTVKIA